MADFCDLFLIEALNYLFRSGAGSLNTKHLRIKSATTVGNQVIGPKKNRAS